MGQTQDPWAVVKSSPRKTDDPWAVVPKQRKVGRGQFFGETPDAKMDAQVGAMIGGPLGGALGGLTIAGPVGVPIGAMIGAGSLGTLGALAEGKELGPAMQAGAGEMFWEAPFAMLGPASGALRKGGKTLVQHSFGPQNAVIKEFGEDIAGDALEALTKLKLERTGVFQPVGGRRAIREVQQQIDDAVRGRKALLEGPAGQRPADPMAAIRAVETPGGEIIHPLKDLYSRTQRTTNPLGDLAAIRSESRDYLRHPLLTERVPRQVEVPLPPELQSAVGRMSPAAELAIRQQLGIAGPKTELVQKMRTSVPAKDLQEIVSGTYKKIDQAGGYMNDPNLVPKRDAAKAHARGLKEEYTRIVPEAIPYNREMEALIPLREALIKAEQGLQADPLVRLGETFALGAARPGLAIGSLLNRPKVESMLGQIAYKLGSGGVRAGEAPLSPAMRLVRMILSGEAPGSVEKAPFQVVR